MSEDEGYFDVQPDAVFDDFRTSESKPLRARAGWDVPVAWEGVFVFEYVKSDAPVSAPEGAIALDKEWMVTGGTYGVSVKDGVETWWEKVDGLWTRRE